MSAQFAVLLLILLSNFVWDVQAQCQPDQPVGGAFINPPPCGGAAGETTYRDNRALVSGSVEKLSWTTNLKLTSDDVFNITLWQENLGSNGGLVSSTPLYRHNAGDQILQSLNWAVQPYELALESSNVFYLEAGWDGPRFFSHYFNITQASTTSSTTASSLHTTSATASSVSVFSEKSGNGLSKEAKIGLGIGIGLGVPLLLILGFVAGIWVIRSRRGQANSTQAGSGEKDKAGTLIPVSSDDIQFQQVHSGSKNYYNASLVSGSGRGPPRHELAGYSGRHEVSG